MQFQVTSHYSIFNQPFADFEASTCLKYHRSDHLSNPFSTFFKFFYPAPPAPLQTLPRRNGNLIYPLFYACQTYFPLFLRFFAQVYNFSPLFPYFKRNGRPAASANQSRKRQSALTRTLFTTIRFSPRRNRIAPISSWRESSPDGRS